MSTKRLFVIKNQFEQYLDKHSGWQSGKDAQTLYRADHHDQALNSLIEVNAKDISLRGEIIEVAMDDKKRPIVEVSESAIALDNDLAKMEQDNPSDIELNDAETDEMASDSLTDDEHNLTPD